MIATKSQIRETLALLQRRPQAVVYEIYSKMRDAEMAGQPIMSALNEMDIVGLRNAMSALKVFEDAMQKYGE